MPTAISRYHAAGRRPARPRGGVEAPAGVSTGIVSRAQLRARGMGAANPPSMVVSPTAKLDPRFQRGQPGVYMITMRVEGIPIKEPLTPYLSTAPFTVALRAAGINGAVTQVKYVRNENPRDRNWADSAISDMIGKSNYDNFIHDRIFHVTVQISDTPKSQLDQAQAEDTFGMGAVQIGFGAGVAILLAIGAVIAVTYPAAGKKIVEGVQWLGEAAAAAAIGAAKKVAENAIPLLTVVAIAAAGIFLLRKGGATFKGKNFSF